MKEIKKKCKKCDKVLPENYKKDLCEACINKKANKLRNIFKGVAVAIGSFTLLALGLGDRKNK